MPKCQACDQENVEGTPMCRNCGAELPEVAQQPSTEPGGEPSADDAELLALVNSGKKIQAVKLYRERHGVGLAEAKDAIEELARQHGIASQGSGCAGVVLLGILGFAAGAAYLLA